MAPKHVFVGFEGAGVAPPKAAKDAVCIVLGQAFFDCSFGGGKGGRGPAPALDVSPKLCVGVGQLVEEHDDREVVHRAAHSLGDEPDDAPVEPDRCLVHGGFFGEEVGGVVLVNAQAVFFHGQNDLQRIVLV